MQDFIGVCSVQTVPCPIEKMHRIENPLKERDMNLILTPVLLFLENPKARPQALKPSFSAGTP